MSNARIRELLTELRQELDSADADAGTRSLMRELDDDIKRVLAAPAGPMDALLDRARQMEANFAAQHAGAERLIRQLIDTLATMGV